MSKSKIVYTYRYMWLLKGKDSMCLRIVAGVKEEHDEFVKVLKDNPEVVSAVRVYLHECDITRLEDFESIKNDKDGEVHEEI